MAITLEELIKETREFDMKLIAGKEGLSNVVRWIHMVENKEISKFLEGNEIAFTIGIGISDDDELIDLIKEIIANGASGIVINIGPYIKNINDKVIGYCNEIEFPLFTVPWKVKMAHIMRIFSMKILESEKINLEFSNAVKNALFFPEEERFYLKVLERYGFLADWSYTVVMLDFDKSNLQEEARYDISSFIIFIQNILVHYSSRTCVFELNDLIVIVFAGYTHMKVIEIIDYMIWSLNNKYKDLSYYIGMGRSTNSAKCIYKSFENAKQILKLNKKIGKKNQITTNSDLGLYKVLLTVDDTTVLREYSSNIIGELEAYDILNKTDYTNFLETYIQSNCNSVDTSEKLFIHKNTVNYKIHKVEEILNCDLSKLECRVKIYMSIMIKNIL